MDLTPIMSFLIPVDETRYNLGWIFITFYIGLFLFNLAVILGPVIRDIKDKMKAKLKANPKYIVIKAKTDQKCDSLKETYK